MIKPRRLTAQKTSPRKARTLARRLPRASKSPIDALTPDEVSHLEAIAKRFEDGEKAWQRMTAPLEEADPWTQVEDHLLARREDADRRWKFFAK